MWKSFMTRRVAWLLALSLQHAVFQFYILFHLNRISYTAQDGTAKSPLDVPTSGVKVQSQAYQPGSAEHYIMSNLDQLGFNKPNNPVTCHIWNDIQATTPDVSNSLATYQKDIDRYNEIIENFKPVANTMSKMRQVGTEQSKICDNLRIHPDGMEAIFPSEQLSFTSSGKLKPTSKLVLLDLGASLVFQGTASPLLTLLRQYEKFGFVFDHIYAFEITKQDPNMVYETLLPEKYISAYHWINVGVSAKVGDKLNPLPLQSIVRKLNEDDFVVVKLDIDTSSIEFPLALELLEDKDGVYSKIIDQFYFEHHVHLGEMALAKRWYRSMNGTVGESLELFSNLRKKGIPAHYWP